MTKPLIVLATLLAWVAGASSATAQSAGTGKVSDTSIDLAVPDSPAFAVLGLTPQAVVHPSSPSELAAGLLNGVDENGNLQTGLAIDTDPYLLWNAQTLDINKYRENPDGWNSARLLSRGQVSFATAKGVNDADKRTRLAAGFRITPWDEGDPHMDKELSKCFDSKIPPIPDEALLTQKEIEKKEKAQPGEKKRIQDIVDGYRANLKKLAPSCREEAQKKNWNRSSWALGLAPTWASESGNTNDVKWDGFGAWTSLAYGFESFERTEDAAGVLHGDELLEWLLYEHSQLIVHARYRSDELVPKPNMTGMFFREDSVAAGGRLRVGTENGGFSGELLYLRDMPKGSVGADKNDYRVSIGAEIKLAEKLWLELSVGQKGPSTSGDKDHGFVLSSLKWGFSQQSKGFAQ